MCPGLNYVGARYTKDGNPADLVSKIDIATQYANAPVSQTAVSSLIATAVGNLASQTSVNNALAGYIQSDYLATREASLIPVAQEGAAGGVAPLDVNGDIPSQFIPSLGVGYCMGPFGPTQNYTASTGAGPVKICDWNIGPPRMNFQPIVFMSVLASALNGGRPVVEVRMSSGAAPYSGQTLVARGVGRNCWNDAQAITVFPASATAGHTGAAGSGYAGTYNAWLSAWLYDANAQSVSVNISNIVSACVWLIRYAA